MNSPSFELRGPSVDKMQFLITEIFRDRCYDVGLRVPAPVIIDCGAHVGITTVFFKHEYPEAEIHAFEPNPTALDYLRANIETAGLTGVTIHPVAVGSRAGQGVLYSSPSRASLRASLQRERRQWAQAIPITIVPLSHLVRSLGHVDLVKMDIEGVEADVIAELTEADVLQLVDHYVLEYHHNIGGASSGLGTLLTHFEKAGYRSALKAQRVAPGEYQDVLLYFARDSSRRCG